MRRDPSSLGMILAKLRFKRGLTQADTVAAMNARGCYMTRQILGNIETGRGTVKHTYITAFLDVYRVDANQLFPPHVYWERSRVVGLAKEVPTRKRRPKSWKRTHSKKRKT